MTPLPKSALADAFAAGAPDYGSLETLLDAGELGVVALDEQLMVRARHGRMLDWLACDVHVVEAMPFLAGFDDSLAAIGRGEEDGFHLPRIAFAGHGPRGVFALRAFADPRPGWVVLLFQDANQLAGLEQQIVQQRNELELARAALEGARDRAEAANRAKADFLANVSHDLRTPLHVVIGNAEILKDDAEGGAGALEAAERRGYVQDIADSGVFLLTLIDDLLDMARADSDRVRLDPVRFDLAELCRECLAIAERLPAARALDVRMERPLADAFVVADRTRLKQVLLNLLGNAVKFTPDGGSVRLSMGRTDASDLEVEVRDDGPGLAPQALRSLFEPFATHGREGGSGLGLHIAKTLIALHGGDLSVDNAAEGGARARLTLPPESNVTGAAT